MPPRYQSTASEALALLANDLMKKTKHSFSIPRNIQRKLIAGSLLLSLAVVPHLAKAGIADVAGGAKRGDTRPNVIMVIFDDLNDWVGPLGGHPDVITPNFDRLAERGISFTNAHVQTPVCMSSRNSFFSGKQPYQLGSYNLQPYYRDLTAVEEGDSLPEHLVSNGYRTFASGKFFHGPTMGEPFTGLGVPEPELPPGDPARAEPGDSINWHDWIWDWGPVDARDEDMPDYRRALEIAGYLKEDIQEPFFIGTNVYQPHVPLHVPQKYFDLYDPEVIHLPDMTEADLKDLGPSGRSMALSGTPRDPTHAALLEDDPGNPKSFVHAYLANITFADACLGVILDAVDASPYADNTYVIAFSDNGFHLGEKQHWAKRTLWHESTRIPLLIAGPGIEPGIVSDRPVGLIDLYPTLVELLGLSERGGLAGHSIVPQIEEPTAERAVPVISTWMPGNHAVRTTRWVYIEYADGEAELYDRLTDHEETTNLINDASLSGVVAELSKWIPKEHADFVRSPRNNSKQ